MSSEKIHTWVILRGRHGAFFSSNYPPRPMRRGQSLPHKWCPIFGDSFRYCELSEFFVKPADFILVGWGEFWWVVVTFFEPAEFKSIFIGFQALDFF